MALGSTAARLEALERSRINDAQDARNHTNGVRDALIDEIVDLGKHVNEGFDKVADRFNNSEGIVVGMSIGALRMECVKLAISGGNNFGAESIAKDADTFFKFIQEGKVPE